MKALTLIIVLLTAGLVTLSAKPVDLPSEKLHLDIPDGLTTSSPGGNILVSATDTQNTTAVNLIKMPNDHADGVDEPDFVKGIQEGFTNKVKNQGMNVTVTQEGQTTLNGVPFYNFQGTFGATGGQITKFYFYVTAANGQIYILSLQTLQPEAEAQLQDIAKSLSFTTPPILPDPNRPKSLSEKIGYLFGVFIAFLAVVSIFKWLRLRAQRRRS